MSETGLGQRIVEARHAKGMSQAALARNLGVKTSTLAAWEHNRSEPRSNRLVMLAGILGVSPSWLLESHNTPVSGGAPLPTDRYSAVRQKLEQVQRLQNEMAALLSALRQDLDELSR